MVEQIFVGNISYQSNEESVREYFSQFGTLKNVLLAKRKQSQGGHRGFAFILYEDESNAQTVLNMDSHTLDERTLTVNAAKPKTRKFFVGGIDTKKTDTEGLRKFFEPYGKIEDVFVVSTRGFGFVTMVEVGDNVEKILEQRKFEIDGAMCDVKLPKKKQEGPRDGGFGGRGAPMRGGYGGGYGQNNYGGGYGAPAGPAWGQGGRNQGYQPYNVSQYMGGRGGNGGGRGGYNNRRY